MNTFLKSSAGGKLNLTLEVPDVIRFFHGKILMPAGLYVQQSGNKSHRQLKPCTFKLPLIHTFSAGNISNSLWLISFHLSSSHLSYSLGCRSQSFINWLPPPCVHTLTMNVLKTHCFTFYFSRSNLTVIHQGPYYNSCQYYRQVFEVETWNLFISLVCFSFLHRLPCRILFVCFGLWTKKLLGEKLFGAVSQLWSLLHTFIKPLFETYTMSPKGLLLCYHTFACDWASGYATRLLIVKSHQFQLSLRPHCYWYKARALKTRDRSEWESDRWRLDNLTEYFSPL